MRETGLEIMPARWNEKRFHCIFAVAIIVFTME